MAEQIRDSASLRENLGAIERPEGAAAARLVEEAEVLIGSAAEDRERRQRQARRDLRVYGVGESDSALARARARTRTRINWIAHRLVNRR